MILYFKLIVEFAFNPHVRYKVFKMFLQRLAVAPRVVAPINFTVGIHLSSTLSTFHQRTNSDSQVSFLLAPSSSERACLRFAALTLRSLCLNLTGRELCNGPPIKKLALFENTSASLLETTLDARPRRFLTLWPSVLKRGRRASQHRKFKRLPLLL